MRGGARRLQLSRRNAVSSTRIPRSLDAVEIRVLGVLLEKEQTTPEACPLTVNAILAGCNQKTNREPVMELGDAEISEYTGNTGRHVIQNVGDIPYQLFAVENLKQGNWSSETALTAPGTALTAESRAFRIYDVRLQSDLTQIRHVHSRTTIAVLINGRAMSAGTESPAAGPAAPVGLKQLVQTGEWADRIKEKNQLNIATAERIAKHCVDAARAKNMGVSVAIVDQFGVIIYYYRADGQGKVNTETALMKAKTVLNTRAPSKAVMNAVRSGNQSEARAISFGNFANSGALPIIVEGQFLGAIGVGGMAPQPGVWSDEIKQH